MRSYKLRLEEMGITRWQYEELKAFCRQYPEKKAQAAELLGVRGGSRITEAKDEHGREIGVAMPRSVRISTPTADAAIKRIRLLEDCALIDQAARGVEDGRWERALRLNCCYGIALACIDQTIMPTASRNAYFRARREFFVRLNEAREAQRGDG